MKSLNDYVKLNSKFLSIPDGESVILIYKGYSIVPDKFKPGSETVSYLFVEPETGRGLPWNKSSNKIALEMKKVEIGQMVRITRFGDGFDTKYKIQVISQSIATTKTMGTSQQEPDETPF